MIPHRYELTDAEWAQIMPMFPVYTTGRPTILVLNAVLWLSRTGAPCAIFLYDLGVGSRSTPDSRGGRVKAS